jgi:hypothetical protein
MKLNPKYFQKDRSSQLGMGERLNKTRSDKYLLDFTERELSMTLVEPVEWNWSRMKVDLEVRKRR